MTLEADLVEWARWLGQGCQVTAGYPSESPTEHIALPFRRCGTAEEQCEDFMASVGADELVGLRVNKWVDALYEPMRTVIRYHYYNMPLDSKQSQEPLERFFERRARLVSVARYKQAMKRYESGFESQRPVWWGLTTEQYWSAYELAMSLLGDFYQRWARGA